MDTMNEKSPAKATDPVYVFMCDNSSRQTGSVAFKGLREVGSMGVLETSDNHHCPPAAEAQDGSPVAFGVDSTPTNWFEVGVDLCLSGRITETRMRRAVDAVRKAGAQ